MASNMASAGGQQHAGDSWYGVLDPRKRKQIQNRLAQRARRKRLSQAGKDSLASAPGTESCTEISGTNCLGAVMGFADFGSLNAMCEDSSSSATSARTPARDFAGMAAVSLWSTPGEVDVWLAFPTSSGMPAHPALPCDQYYLHVDSKITAIMAVTENGSLLGLTCNGSSFAKSPPQPTTIPQSLFPTPLQLSTPHADWIDRFPFPRMRDNIIILGTAIDEKEIFCDFFLMPSFAIRPNGCSWDPGAWLISPQFNSKWGYLFY